MLHCKHGAPLSTAIMYVSYIPKIALSSPLAAQCDQSSIFMDNPALGNANRANKAGRSR